MKLFKAMLGLLVVAGRANFAAADLVFDYNGYTAYSTTPVDRPDVGAGYKEVTISFATDSANAMKIVTAVDATFTATAIKQTNKGLTKINQIDNAVVETVDNGWTGMANDSYFLIHGSLDNYSVLSVDGYGPFAASYFANQVVGSFVGGLPGGNPQYAANSYRGVLTLDTTTAKQYFQVAKIIYSGDLTVSGGMGNGDGDTMAFNFTVPDPATLSLLGIGAVGLLLRRRRA